MPGFQQRQPVARGTPAAEARPAPAARRVPDHPVPPAHHGPGTPAPAGDNLLARRLATAVQHRSGALGPVPGMVAPDAGGPVLQRWRKVKPLRAAEHKIRWALSADQRASDEMVAWNDERDASAPGASSTTRIARGPSASAEGDAYRAEVAAAQAAGTYVLNEDIEDEEEETVAPWVPATRSWVPGRRR